MAAARVRAGDLRGAQRAYREADRLAPAADKAEIASRLGWLAKESGDTGSARRYFAKARGDGPLVPVSTVILAATIIVSLVVLFTAEGPDLLQVLWLDKVAVADGEYWRLWTVTLVHADLLHLFFNMYALYLAGPIVERWYGSLWFLVMYLACAAAGSVASFVFGGDVPAVGASGAIFGLFGVLLAANRVHHPVDRATRGIVSQLGFLVLLNLVFGFASGGQIDNAAHLGGLFAGLWLGAAIRPAGVPTMSAMWRRGRGEPTGAHRGPAALAEAADTPRFVPAIAVGAVVVVVVAGLFVGTAARSDEVGGGAPVAIGAGPGSPAPTIRHRPGLVFGTLLGALPRPPLAADATRDAILDAVVAAQVEAGLEPVTDGGWPLVPGDPVASWRATAARTERAVKAVLPGPYTSGIAAGGPVESLRDQVRALIDAGCPMIEIAEPAAVAIGADEAERARFRDLHERLLAGLVDAGPDGLEPGRPPVPRHHGRRRRRGRPGHDPGSGVRQPGRRPHRRPGQLAPGHRDAGRARHRLRRAVRDRRARTTGRNCRSGRPPMPRRAAGRGPARVGVATASSLAGLSWAVATAKLASLAEVVRLAALPPDERLAAIDPRAIDSRSAALGRYEPARARRAARPTARLTRRGAGRRRDAPISQRS